MSKSWSFAFLHLSVLLLVALGVGLIIGHVQAALLLAVSVALFVQWMQLYRLSWWLQHRSAEDAPDLGGLWGEIIALIMRIYRRKLFLKRRTVELFREFRQLSASVPDGVLVLSGDRDIQWFNQAAGRLLGLRRKVDFGQRIDNLLRHPDFVSYIERRDYATPVIVRSAQDNELYLSLQLVVHSAERQLLLVRDVTREVRLDAMRKDFVANASHELRSPLTVITGYVDALAEDMQKDPLWQGPLSEMSRQAVRMRSVVDSLIELSRLESTVGEAGDERVDVGAMLSSLTQENLALTDRPATIALHLESTASLLGASRELHSVFANLISNAVKYTPSSGRVDIRWWADDSGAHFSVADTGTGIAPEHIPRLTERFYRVDQSRHRSTGGAGLGLAIVKHALTRHGATLEVTSEEMRGSVFTCHFPTRRLAA
jgi:two-component system phosphate regulon sensor histidine kinase PhoR